MASALPVVFAALLLACATSAGARSARHERSLAISTNTSVDVSLDANATTEIIAGALRDGGSALETARAEVARVAAQIQSFVDSAREQGTCVSEDLLEHVEDEARFTVQLVNAGTCPDLERLVQELEHLQGDMRIAAEQAQNDSTCEQLAAELRSIEANLSVALGAVHAVMQPAEDAAQKVVLQVNVTISKQVDILIQKCQTLIHKGQEVIQNITTDVELFNSEFADFLRLAAEAAIAAGRNGIQQINIIVKNWKGTLEQLQLQINLLIVANFDTSQNQTSTGQKATELGKSIQSSLKTLSLKLNSEIKYIDYIIFTYRRGLELQSSMAVQLINILKGNSEFSITEIVNELLQLKEIALQNVSLNVNQILQFVNKTNSLNNSHIKQILLAITKDAETIQMCIQNKNIPRTVEVILQLQTHIQILIRKIQNTTEDSEELRNIAESLLKNIEIKLEAIYNITHILENKIKKFVTIFSNDTQVLLQNAETFVKSIVNTSNNFMERINVTQTQNSILKYILQILIEGVVRESNKALSTLKRISSILQFYIEQIITKIIQIVLNSNISNGGQNVTYVETQVDKTIYIFVNKISGIITSTLQIQFTLSEILSNQLNSINGLSIISINDVLNQIHHLGQDAFLELEQSITLIQQFIELALSSNVTVITQIVQTITVQLDYLIQAYESFNIIQVIQAAPNLISILEGTLDQIASLSGAVVGDWADRVQSLIANLTYVSGLFVYILEEVKLAVQSTVTSISGLLGVQLNALITFATQLIVQVEAALEKITQVFGGVIGNGQNRFLQTILTQLQGAVKQLEARQTELISGINVVTNIVTLIISSFRNVTVSDEFYLEIIQQINISLSTWVSDVQVVISYYFELLLTISDSLNIQESIISIFTNIISGVGLPDIRGLLNQLVTLGHAAFLELELSITLIQQFIELALSSNVTVITQLVQTITVQLDYLIQAYESFNIIQVIQAAPNLISILEGALDQIASLSGAVVGDWADRVQSLIANLTYVSGLFVYILEEVKLEVQSTVTSISGLVGVQLNALITFATQLIVQVEAALEKITQVIGGELENGLKQIFHLILTCLQDALNQLEASIGVLMSGESVLSHIIDLIISNYNNFSVSGVGIIELSKEVNFLLVLWVSKIYGFFSFYLEYFINFDISVRFLSESSVKLYKFLSGSNTYNIYEILENALYLRNNAIQLIDIFLKDFLDVVNSLPAIGVDLIQSLLSVIISQVNSILNSIERGNIESIVLEIKDLLSGIKSFINEVSNIGQVPGVSNVLENLVTQLGKLEGNITTALGSINDSVNLISVLAHEVTSRLGYLVEYSVTIFASLGQLFIFQGNAALQYLAGNSSPLKNNTDDEVRDLAGYLINVGGSVVEHVEDIVNIYSIGFLEDKFDALAAKFLFNISLNATDVSSLELELRSVIFSGFNEFLNNVYIRIIDVMSIISSASKPLLKAIEIIFRISSRVSQNISGSIDELLILLLQLQQTVQSKVTAFGAQTLEVVGELETLVSADLLAIIRSQIEYVLNLASNSSEIEVLSVELDNLASALEKALQYVRNTANNLQGDALVEAQRLIGELEKIITNVNSALGAVKDVIQALADVVQKAAVNMNHLVQQNVNDLLNRAQLLIRKGEAALNKFTNNSQGLGEEFFQRLVEAGQVSIDAGYEAIKEAESICSKWNASLETIELEIKALILGSLENIGGTSVNIIELVDDIINAINNQPNLLLSQVKIKIQRAQNLIYSALISLENTIQMTFKLLHSFKVVLTSIQFGNESIDLEALLYNLTQVQKDVLHEGTLVIAEILEVLKFAFENNNTINTELLATIQALATTALQLAQSGNVSVVDQLQQLLEQLLTSIETVLKQARDASRRLEGEAQRTIQIFVTQLVSLVKNTTTLLNTVKASVVIHTLFVVQEAFQIAYDKVHEQVNELIIRGQRLIQNGEAVLGNATTYALQIGPDAVAKLEEVARTCIAAGHAAIEQAKGIINNLTISFEAVIESVFKNIGENVVNITQIKYTIVEISTKQLATLVIQAQSAIDTILSFVFGAQIFLETQTQITLKFVHIVKTLLSNFNSSDLSDVFNVSLSRVNRLQQAIKEQVRLLTSGILEIVGVAGAESGVVSADLLAAIKALAETVSQLALNGTASAIIQLQEPLQKLLEHIQIAVKQSQNASLVLQGEARAVAQQVVASLLEAVDNITDALYTVKACVIAEALHFVHEAVAESYAIMQKEVQALIYKGHQLIREGEEALGNASKNAQQLGEKTVAKLVKAGQEAIAAGHIALQQANNISLSWTASVAAALQASINVELDFDNIAQTISQISESISSSLKVLQGTIQDTVRAAVKVLSGVENSLQNLLADILNTIGDIIGGVGDAIGSTISNLGDSFFSNFTFKLG